MLRRRSNYEVIGFGNFLSESTQSTYSSLFIFCCCYYSFKHCREVSWFTVTDFGIYSAASQMHDSIGVSAKCSHHHQPAAAYIFGVMSSRVMGRTWNWFICSLWAFRARSGWLRVGSIKIMWNRCEFEPHYKIDSCLSFEWSYKTELVVVRLEVGQLLGVRLIACHRAICHGNRHKIMPHQTPPFPAAFPASVT